MKIRFEMRSQSMALSERRDKGSIIFHPTVFAAQNFSLEDFIRYLTF